MSSGPSGLPHSPSTNMSNSNSHQSGHAPSPLPRVRHSDSWIEVSSQAPSSSASSVHDEVITHGLRVHNTAGIQRRRHAPLPLSLRQVRSPSATSSSQEEYEESESESDQVMTSSNEEHPVRPAPRLSSRLQPTADDGEEEEGEEDDEDATALGLGARSRDDAFTPQPNAFSHPPSSSNPRAQSYAGTSYFPVVRPVTARSTSERAVRDNAYFSSSPAADHDAALRASLTTLLSCAAAARSLPKSKPREAQQPAYPSARAATSHVEPSSLRIIPVSQMHSRRRSPSSSRRRSSTSPCPSDTASSGGEKHKRKASRSGSKERREVKRLRAVTVDEAISPTLLTWVVSAGVLVLVSALSFSAGYSTGREAGRAESFVSPTAAAGDCGRQSRSGMGFRRRLFGGAAQAVSA